MNPKEIRCVDCSMLLATLNKKIVASMESTSLCYECANVRYMKMEEEKENL